MGLLRSALLKHPLLALAIALATLGLRLAVPAGYMPVVDHGRLTLAICSGSGPVASAPSHQTTSSTAGTSHHDEDRPKAESGCAFADLALPVIGGANSVQLTAALAFIVSTGLFPATVSPAGAALRLRPPLRGPPLPY